MHSIATTIEPIAPTLLSRPDASLYIPNSYLPLIPNLILLQQCLFLKLELTRPRGVAGLPEKLVDPQFLLVQKEALPTKTVCDQGSALGTRASKV
jgi:hypothetical protein